ncbi:helix-turn-helix transcriptional regulator [Lactococcus cremoris]
MDKEIGKIFRELRQEKGLSLEKASEGVISISQLSHFERGKGITTGKFFALIKILMFQS